MKLNWWLLCGVMVSTSLLAQQVTNRPAGAPAAAPALTNTVPATNAPAAKSGHKKSGKKKAPAAPAKKDAAAELKTVPLVPGLAVVEANHVNVRGQAKLKSEVVTRLNKGDAVTVLQEITRNNSAVDEPSAWAKILLPTNVHVWVNTPFIDATNKTVLPKKLNLRSGPGENYSVVGQLVRGEPVKDLGTKESWTEIEAPTNAYAFVAAQFLKQEAPGATPAEPTAEPSKVNEPPVVAAAPTEPPAVTNAVAETAATTNEATVEASTNAAPAVEEPPPMRIVQREGIVRGTVSIQAPTAFGLYSAENGRLIDYLYTTSLGLDLRRYKGLRIIVTGEEGLEERWGNTPVITIQKIQVLEE
jgi:uncharacterized protein YgiM (DUF1202 family)